MILRIVFSCQLSVVSYQLSVISCQWLREPQPPKAFRGPQCGFESLSHREHFESLNVAPQAPRAFRGPQCGFESLSHRAPQATVLAMRAEFLVGGIDSYWAWPPALYYN